MSLMRCLFCGLLQDEPVGVKACARCGGELAFAEPASSPSYVQAEMELDQISAPADQIVSRHLVVTIRTPSEVPQDEAAPTTSGREPLSFAAALDVSGSMRGPKIEAAKEGVCQALRRLHDGDVFSLVTFADEAKTVQEPVKVDARLRKKAEGVVKEVDAGGMTALCGGLETGIEVAQAQHQLTNLVLLLSDGQANVGETDLEAVGHRALKARQNGITTSTLGVGRDYNEALMVEIANQGGGRFYHVLEARQIAPFIAGELGEIGDLAARDTVLRLALPGGTGLEPFAAAHTVTSQSEVSLGDIPTDTELEVVVRLLLPPQPADSRLRIEGSLSYRSPAGNELTMPLNVVTLRYAEAEAFERREGAVLPVVERVLEQMQARGVLGAVRTDAVMGAAAGDKERRLGVEGIRAYASLLGDEEAEKWSQSQAGIYDRMFADAEAHKAAVQRAYQRHYQTKAFDED
jgi:Ca-activated chloride channel family protein